MTTYTWDAQNRLKKIRDPRGAETTLAYDLAGRLTSVTDAAGNVTSYTYDAATREVDALDDLERQLGTRPGYTPYDR